MSKTSFGFKAIGVMVLVGCAQPSLAVEAVRFATYNASLNRNAAGQLVDDLSVPFVPNTAGFGVNANQALRIQQAKNIAEVVQRVNPDVLLINEFDYVAGSTAVNLFNQNFLQVSQNGQTPVNYTHSFVAPSNTGIASGKDLNNNGVVVTTPGANGYGDDAFGFGNFEGHFGMAFYSKHAIVGTPRTFQNFLWKDMPGNLLTNDPTVDNPGTTVNENLNGFYSPDEIAILRLSSKSHWDVPILVDGEVIHVLMSHPTPPVFDGTEDRNGKRNHDEIRFWADYVSGAGYMYDDAGVLGGLAPGTKFVIMGDQNADPRDGDSFAGAISQLLAHPLINTSLTPSSVGGTEAAAAQGGANLLHLSDPRFDTADFADGTPGNLRADYVLPSSNLGIQGAGIFWPGQNDPLLSLVGNFNPAVPNGFTTSDHRLVFVDVTPIPEPTTMVMLGLAGVLVTLRRQRLA